MSESQGGAGRREVAFRLFAAEYDDADLSYSESDEERAPNYVITPTGARVNRLFVVGVLTEVEAVSDDYLRARVVDPTGPFVVYAGQYQPEAMNFLERADPPMFVAVTGKARTFQPEDSDRVYTSIRPESINEVDAQTRDRWVVQAAEQTIDRVTRMAEAKQTGLDGESLTAALQAHDVDDGLANGIPLALEHYGPTGEYLAAVRELATDAARVVAGERDEVAGLQLSPADGDDDSLASLVDEPIDVDEHEPGDEVPDVADAPDPDSDPSPTDEEIDDAVEAADLDDDSESDGTESSTGEPSDSAKATGETTESETVESPSTETQTTDTATAEAQTTDTGSSQTSTAPADEDGSADTDAEDGAETDSVVDDASASTEDATEAADIEEAATDEADDDLEEFDGEFELDEEERAEIEQEYGTEFQSGSEVDDPGEADIETPTDEPGGEDASDEASTAAETSETDGEERDDTSAAEADVDESETASEEEDDVETAADVALDDAVMDAMTDLDDGDGADRDAVVAEVVETTGADPGDVEDAIQDALMDGRCYEPDDETLKAI